MEVVIISLLIAIVVELYDILKNQKDIANLLQRISLGLFPIPNGGLDKLVYLEHIDDKLQLINNKLEKITKSQ
jgi:hypothetical protein